MNYRGYSVRALGMGNAFTAVADTHDTIYYNMAGLNKIEGIYLTILDPYVGVNDLTELEDTLDNGSGSSGDDFVELIRDIYGKNIFVMAGAKAGFTMKNFSIHYYDQGELNALMTNPTFPELDLTFKNDHGFHLGGAFEIVPNLAIGFGLRNINRTGGSYKVSIETLEDLDTDAIEDEVLREGTGYGLDMGLLYSSKIGNLTSSFGFAWHNLGDVSFKAKSGEQAPSSEKSYMSLGFATHIDLAIISLIPAVDYKFLDRNDISFEKKLDLGLEVDFPLVTARGGLHHGYLTYGATLDLAFLQIDVASYAEELGAYPGQAEDRRYAAQFKIELGLDANFNAFKLDRGARRKLKQRR
jgi:hypothetical protein